MSQPISPPDDFDPIAVATAIAPTLTELQRVFLSVDRSGNLRTLATATIVDGGNVVEGTIADAAVVGDNSGTLSAKLRGISKILNSVWSSVNGYLLVSQTPTTSGGLSISRTLSANNTTGIVGKGSTGQVYGWAITNVNAAARFVKLYNVSSAPTVGTTVPVITLMIPGNATGSGMVAAEFTSGIAFSTGIGIGITTGVADNDTGAPAANEVIVNLFYK